MQTGMGMGGRRSLSLHQRTHATRRYGHPGVPAVVMARTSPRCAIPSSRHPANTPARQLRITRIRGNWERRWSWSWQLPGIPGMAVQPLPVGEDSSRIGAGTLDNSLAKPDNNGRHRDI